jgi:HK97 gp10 family phage protein
VAKVSVNFPAAAITAKYVTEVKNRVDTATTVLHAAVVKKVSSPPPPSKPGEPPHVQTGRLRQSIQPSPARVTGTVIEGEVSTNVEYAPGLEYGTRKMAARPFMRPALAENEKRLKSILSGGKS